MQAIGREAVSACSESVEIKVAGTRRKRERMLANRELRYVQHRRTGMVHDRDCKLVGRIADADFAMCEEFPVGQTMCPRCFRQSLIRAGMEPYLYRYLNVVLQVFDRVGATDEELYTLFITRRARVTGLEKGDVCVRVNEDRWCIRPSGKGCLLYHNNYRILSENERQTGEGFHLQVSGVIPFRKALDVMTSYTWNAHLAGMKRRRQGELRLALTKVCNYAYEPRLSLFFKYVQIADYDGEVQQRILRDQLPLTVIRVVDEGTGHAIVRCRVKRWECGVVERLARAVKEACVQSENTAYQEFCERYVGRVYAS